METLKNNGYVGGAVMMDHTIEQLRSHVEFEKFICRMLIDNDDTRQMKQNTEELKDSVHRFIYNNPEINKLTMRGKNELVGKTAYVPTQSGVVNGN